jgi:class 3 adenylate cyclase
MRQECVGCHNTRHDSPKTGWQPGDVRGVQEVMLALPPVWGGSATSLGWTLGGMLVLALGGVGLLAMVVTRLRTSVQETAAANRQLAATNTALDRFVPHDFLQRLDKANITEVSLGDHVQQEMTILFSDIRNFTALSEGMTPEANFQFLNAYLGGMGPMVREYGGFIDKYLGDGIMALFPQADAALEAALAMLHHLEIFNHARQQRGESPIAIGIGLNTGHLMLGTIGEYHRMEGTVISDAVNLASRMEGLTKQYGTPLLVSHHTVARLQETERLPLRLVDRVTVKGKHDPVEVYEVYAADRPEVRTLKALTGEDFAIALKHYQHGEFTLAQALFQSCWQRNPADRAAALYVERCTVALRSNLSDTWDGVTHLDSK